MTRGGCGEEGGDGESLKSEKFAIGSAEAAAAKADSAASFSAW